MTNISPGRMGSPQLLPILAELLLFRGCGPGPRMQLRSGKEARMDWHKKKVLKSARRAAKKAASNEDVKSLQSMTKRLQEIRRAAGRCPACGKDACFDPTHKD